MVYRELKSAHSVLPSLMYNIRKVNGNVATVDFVKNIPDTSVGAIINTLTALEKKNIRTEKVSFHATFNPVPEDNMTPEKMQEFIKAFMEKRGYGRQPYSVFSHEDIERAHYHVVSIRTDDAGHAIIPKMILNKKGETVPYRLEKRYSYEILKQLQRRFHYKIGKSENRKLPKIASFNRPAGHIKNQLSHIFQTARDIFVFTTKAQFSVIMEHFGVKVRFEESRHLKGKDEMILQGMENGKAVTRCTFLGTEDIDRFNETLSENKKRLHTYRENILDIESAFVAALRDSENEEQLAKKLGESGIELKINRSVDGAVYGVTFFDWKQYMAYKGSDVNKDIRTFLNAADYSEVRKKPIEEHYKTQREKLIFEQYLPHMESLSKECESLKREMSTMGLWRLANNPVLQWGKDVLNKSKSASSLDELIAIERHIKEDVPMNIVSLLSIVRDAFIQINGTAGVESKRILRKAAGEFRERYSTIMKNCCPECQEDVKAQIREMQKEVDDEMLRSMAVEAPGPENVIRVGEFPCCQVDAETVNRRLKNEMIAHNIIVSAGNVKKIFKRSFYASNEYVSDQSFRNFAFKAEFMDGAHFVLCARRQLRCQEEDRYYISELYTGQAIDQLKWENQFGDFLLYDDIRKSIDKYDKEMHELYSNYGPKIKTVEQKETLTVGH